MKAAFTRKLPQLIFINKVHSKVRKAIFGKKGLANAVFASLSFMRQTGLEAPPLAEIHASAKFPNRLPVAASADF